MRTCPATQLTCGVSPQCPSNGVCVLHAGGRQGDDVVIVSPTGERRETINHPRHYGGDVTYEAIKVIEAWQLDFSLGNAVKYISRAGKKPGSSKLEDLKKAKWYLERAIKNAEHEQAESAV